MITSLQGAVGAWATPPHPQGLQDRLRDYGQDGEVDVAASRRHRRTFPGTTGQLGAVDASADSAGAAVPFEGLLAGRIRRRTMLEYTVASGRLVHATFQERADA